jgi:hypothetical protein
MIGSLRLLFMTFNATFNNISIISWRSVLMLEESRVSGENHRPAASHWLSYIILHPQSFTPFPSKICSGTTIWYLIESAGYIVLRNNKCLLFYCKNIKHPRGPRCRDRMVVGFTTTYAISAIHHWSYEFESRSWPVVLDATLCDKVCQWLAAGRWFSPDTLLSSSIKTDRHDIIEILLNVYQ